MVDDDTGTLIVSEACKNTAQENADLATMQRFMRAMRDAIDVVHRRNSNWWVDPHTGEAVYRNFGEILALIHSELSEALEGHRKNLADDKLTNRPMVEVEFADAIIRIMDAAGGFNFDVAGAWYEKMQYNYTRKDHTLEHRRSEHGKKY